MLEFPMEMFLPGSDLTPINENIDKIIYGLTKWEPMIKEAGIYAPPKVTVVGQDYQEAFANYNLLALKNGWGDGLPVLPPTEERVNWILTGTDLSPDTVVAGGGKILPKGGIATVETIAVSLAMAGGRPEYLPVLIAAIEAMTDPLFQHDNWNATTNSNYPAFVINGPVAKQIRLNSGYGCLGPNPEYPAGASIGRAIRFLLVNAGGGFPGKGSMAIHGGANKYTNIVFAEDEEGLPPGWEPLNVELGFPSGSSTVTAHGVNSTINLGGGSTTTEEAALNTLTSWANVMRVPGYGQAHSRPPNFHNGAPGLLIMARGSAAGLADLGWSKEDVRNFFWEATTLTPDEVKEYGEETAVERSGLPPGSPLPLTETPDNFRFVVAGGAQSGHGYWMSTVFAPFTVPTVEIKLPANWDELLEKAEEELGPLPD